MESEVSDTRETRPVPLAALAEIAPRHGRAWLVGGAVRDSLLGRPTPDYDLAVKGDARELARELGRVADGHAFLLSDEFGAWRVRGREQDWQVDLTPLMGETLEQDLARRDLTINAMAKELAYGAGSDGDLIDPYGGVADLEGRALRAVSERSFSADPLRVMRLARIAAELGFEPDADTVALASSAAPALSGVAAERVFTEFRLLLCSAGVISGLELAHAIGATAEILPELDALRGVEQSEFHSLDVYGHTIAALERAVALEGDPSATFGELGAALADVLGEPLANEMTRGQALRLGALLHDIAKPVTRAVTADGRVTFFHHDRVGAELVTQILTRMRASERLTGHIAAMTRNHLRLGFLVHKRPLSRRSVYEYLAACDPVEVDVTVLSVADRVATRGRNHEAAIASHLELTQEILADALAWRASRPRSPIAGDALASALGIDRGPQLGRLIAELTAAAYADEIDSYEAMLAHARAWLAADSSPTHAVRPAQRGRGTSEER
jgi:putative nucleotidyltransferase with HDIG domain